jgi:hypothetical protein
MTGPRWLLSNLRGADIRQCQLSNCRKIMFYMSYIWSLERRIPTFLGRISERRGHPGFHADRSSSYFAAAVAAGVFPAGAGGPAATVSALGMVPGTSLQSFISDSPTSLDTMTKCGWPTKKPMPIDPLT